MAKRARLSCEGSAWYARFQAASTTWISSARLVPRQPLAVGIPVAPIPPNDVGRGHEARGFAQRTPRGLVSAIHNPARRHFQCSPDPGANARHAGFHTGQVPNGAQAGLGDHTLFSGPEVWNGYKYGSGSSSWRSPIVCASGNIPFMWNLPKKKSPPEKRNDEACFARCAHWGDK